MQTDYSSQEINNLQRLLLSDDMTNLELAFSIIQEDTALLYELRHVLALISLWHEDGQIQARMRDWLIQIEQRPVLFDLTVFQQLYIVRRWEQLRPMVLRFKEVFPTYQVLFGYKLQWLEKLYVLVRKLAFFRQYELALFFCKRMTELRPEIGDYHGQCAFLLRKLPDLDDYEKAALAFHTRKAEELGELPF